MFTLDNVLEGTGGRLAAGQSSAAFRSVSIDSRATTRGELFAAFRGQKHDGHTFVTQALARGAAGALIETLESLQEPWSAPGWSGAPIVQVASTGQALQELAAYWRRRHDIRVVGVTGSVGKTTTKELIAGVLGERYSVLHSPANLNTEIGLPLTLMKLEPGHQIAVLEMAMHDVGEIRRLAHIARTDIGVVTNVQPSHMARLGSIERIAEAKSELVQDLPSSGAAILNADDERVRVMAELTSAEVVTYGTSAGADFWADEIESHGLRGIEFTVRHRTQRAHAKMSILGTHSVHAALAAVAVATRVGMDFEESVAALMQLRGGLRIVVAEGIRGSTILDDTYNANPESTLAALNLLADMDGRRVAVLGDMLELGSLEAEGHRIVGLRAARVADWLLTVGPRGETVAQEARSAGMSPGAVETFQTNDDVIARLREGLRPGDFVLLKGSRGMRLDEVVSAIRATA